MEPTTSQKILDVAQLLVGAGGYNGFSYADISDAIGIRKASIHHHFPTKSELVAVLVEQYAQRARAGLSSLRESGMSPLEQLQAYLNYWQACIRDSSEPFCICAMLAAEMQMLPEDVASGVRAHFRHLTEWLVSVLEAGVAEGQFRLDRSPEEEAQILMASVHGAMLSARALANPELFPAVVEPQIARLRA
ncbi:TetR/AcrR family transcriptional regulator [Neorhizobium sp. P12A]|uniref:TetR/AcrR family transcriptional regulator n=1 Tax=Neorhizobium sp. P12A TaxID=2268027 RepID=UPI0011EC070C|nr:TetR/AcrR family transcriptional regulator [Neorhizobium sp. P12A]KAA0700261.1 TetR/AcrR family transcriptional regulator [Neorhizobium sp. P12A]